MHIKYMCRKKNLEKVIKLDLTDLPVRAEELQDQSIYGFRAAYPEALLAFKEDYPLSLLSL